MPRYTVSIFSESASPASMLVQRIARELHRVGADPVDGAQNTYAIETDYEHEAKSAVQVAVNWLQRSVKDVSARLYRHGTTDGEIMCFIRPDPAFTMPLRIFYASIEVGRAVRIDNFAALASAPRSPRQYDERVYGIDGELRQWTRDRRRTMPREGVIEVDDSRLRLAFADATLTADGPDDALLTHRGIRVVERVGT